MNIKKIQIVNEFLTEQMNHWILFPLPLTVMGVVRALTGEGEPCLLIWALCSLIPLSFFVFRCRIKNLILFALAHLGTAAVVFLLSGQSVFIRLVCLVCVAGYLLQSFLLRLKQHSVYSDGMPLVFGVGLSAVTVLFQHYQGTSGWENYYHFALIAVIALYFIIYYIEHYLNFLSMNESSAGFLPAAEMFHSGMGMALGYTLLGMAILVFSMQFEWLAGLLRPVRDLLLRFLRFLFSHNASPEEEIIPIEQEMPMNDMGDMGLPEGGGTFWLWDVLEAVMMVVFICAIVAGIVALLWKLFQLIQKYMVFRYQEQEVETGEAYDFREKCEIEKDISKKGRSLFEALSPRERVRKIYKKKLSSAGAHMEAADKESLGLYTAREWEQKLALDGMAHIYEQARYSNQEITGADVKKLKEIWK